MREVKEGGVKSFDALDSREKTIAILGDRWWPQTAKQDGDKMCKRFPCNVWKTRNERPNVGGVSIRSRNGAPLIRDAWLMAMRLKQATIEYVPPPKWTHHHRAPIPSRRDSQA